MSSSKLTILEEPIDYARPMRVIIMGTGFSGLAAAYHLSKSTENVEFVLYEKNDQVGGTWYENHYPGVACDVPAHAYQFTFVENTQWSKFYADGSELHAYLRDCAAKIGLQNKIKLEHEVIKAEWDESAGKWTVTVRDIANNKVITDLADVVISATGALNHRRDPAIEGIETFKGKIVHTAAWDLEPAGDAWKDRRVAVIGYGSSATQVAPALQPYVKSIDNYIRGKTWIYQPFVPVDQYPDGKTGNHVFTEEELKDFADKEKYKEFRYQLEDACNTFFPLTLDGSDFQNMARKGLEEAMKARLAARPDIAENLIPDFPVSCRRLTPGIGYLEALTAPNASFINTEIKRITEDGIETADGTHRPYDVIVAATGFDTSCKPRFPILGRKGMNLQDLWADYPKTYLGISQDGFPNWFQIGGPNTGIAVGPLIPMLEKQGEYVTQCIRKMQYQRIKTMAVQKKAVEAFQAYCDAYFPRTIFGKNCPSWYKNGKPDGRITGLWPGSTLHHLRVLEQPRYEDYDYTYLDGSVDDRASLLRWLGNGMTVAEVEGKPGTRAWYYPRV
ncbi:putative flavin-binding monooxygenase [Neolentinus lepideus HHB14362 ss-1]|uniref:Putative flavin-binding monooxygenase n=1 Tax=Neolentinus lepideus HHB14362 ss-1 TaxID=1314782 RepID=A0A165STC4_9AGAM|nr:putative flavin-binding monooxygenase [Neolentinus lepideus HHB14362 ss-1]